MEDLSEMRIFHSFYEFVPIYFFKFNIFLVTLQIFSHYFQSFRISRKFKKWENLSNSEIYICSPEKLPNIEFYLNQDIFLNFDPPSRILSSNSQSANSKGSVYRVSSQPSNFWILIHHFEFLNFEFKFIINQLNSGRAPISIQIE